MAVSVAVVNVPVIVVGKLQYAMHLSSLCNFTSAYKGCNLIQVSYFTYVKDICAKHLSTTHDIAIYLLAALHHKTLDPQLSTVRTPQHM